MAFRPVLVVLCGLLAAAPVAAPAVFAASGPTVSPPNVFLKSNVTLTRSGSVPIGVAWSRASSPYAPLARYELEFSRDYGTWVTVALPRPLIRSVTITTRPWAVVRYRLRAVDTAGVASAWAESAPSWLSVFNESDPEIALSSGWATSASTTAVGGSRAVTTDKGATASFSFTGRSVAWVSRYGPGAGEADVTVDEGAAIHVDLQRSTWRPRRVVFVATWPTAGNHTLKLTTTQAGDIVDADAFVVLDTARDATLVGAGDIASCSLPYDEATVALALTVEGTVFTTGDNVYPDGSPINFAYCYDPSWGVLKSRTRPVPGNHDYNNNPGAAGYFAYFGAAAGPPGLGWYRYDAGTWRVYALNSECGRTACTQQLEWLRADLTANPHRCTVAIWHKPRFSTGPHGDSTKMAVVWQLLHEQRAEVVLVGHDHGYQRYRPLDALGAPDPVNGLRQFVVGTGGASLYAFESESANVEIRDRTSHGVLRLDLKPGGYSWQFMPVAGDTFTDSGSGSCH